MEKDDLKEIRSAINQETNLINTRLSIITASNGLFLATLGLIINSKLAEDKFIFLLHLVCFSSIAITLIFLITIIMADTAIKRYMNIYQDKQDSIKSIVPIIGLRINKHLALLLWCFIPFVFVLLWILIFMMFTSSI